MIDEGDVPYCVDENDDRLVSASSDVFATDRRTAEAVNDPKYLPPSAEEKSGLINKWPFDAEKKDYTYWDGMLGEAVDATYDGSETIDGLETYKYHVLVEDAPAEVVDGIDGVYSQDKYLWIDPVTGAIIKQTQHEVRKLEDGSTAARHAARLHRRPGRRPTSPTPRTTASCWACSRSTLPLVGFIGGAIALLAGLFLFLAARRRERRRA